MYLCITLMLTILISTFLKISFLSVNFSHNKNQAFDTATDASGYIVNQNALSNYKFGLSTMDNNGCGIICLYNTLLMFNKQEPLTEIIKEMEFSAMGYGLLGTHPLAFMRYLTKRGFSTSIESKTRNYDTFASKQKTTILISYSLNGGHYEQLKFNDDTGYYDIINGYGVVTSLANNLQYNYSNYNTFLIGIN